MSCESVGMAETIRELTPPEVQSFLHEHPDAQLVDVREPWEFTSGRLPGALSMPLGTVSQRSGELDKDRPIVVVCAGGVRSLDACQILASQGFGELISVAQGTKGWIRHDLPIEK